jgi:hypothetical protein
VPHPRTMVTEVGTALGMLGHDTVDGVLASRSPVMRSLSPDDWDHLGVLRAGGAYDAEFHAAWENGRAFLTAGDGLRGRTPEVVEWKGAIRAPGDEVAPIDLRIDHVYLVSCKYLSKILFNVSPSHVFDDLLVGGQARRGRSIGQDWFAEVAADRVQALYDEVRRSLDHGATNGGGGARPGVPLRAGPGSGRLEPRLPGLDLDHDLDYDDEVGRAGGEGPGALSAAQVDAALRQLPGRVGDLTSTQREALGRSLRSGWPGDAKASYQELAAEVARSSAARWRQALTSGRGAAEAMLWRLLRMGSTPYFVLGSSATHSLRLRIATPWDWRQVFTLVSLEIFAQPGGQARVGWVASVREQSSGQLHEVAGHVDVRWSHGRFSGPPEAKGYLDTPHQQVPGYFALR